MGGVVVVEGVLFRPFLLANKPIVDIAFIQEDTIKRDFFVSIANKESYSVYPKLVCNIPNWSFEGASYKELGELSAGAEKYYKPRFTRPKPTPEYGTDLVDSGNLRLEVYKDSAYTDYYGAYNLPVDMRVVYMTAFPHVQQWSFYDGTEQGWTLTNMEISNARYFGGTKYAPRGYCSYSVNVRRSTSRSCTVDGKISREVVIPNDVKVFGKIYVYAKIHAYANVSASVDTRVRVQFRQVRIKCNGIDIYSTPLKCNVLESEAYGHYGGCSRTIEFKWGEFAFDLSQFAGQTCILEIEAIGYAYSWHGPTGYYDPLSGYVEIAIDLPTIAGKG